MTTDTKWITKDFLNNILTTFLKKDLAVLDFTICPAIPVGENYTSDLLKITITYSSCSENEVVSVITKCCPADKLLINYAKDMRLFEQEIAVYDEIIPALNSLGYTEKIAPAAIYVSYKKYIIMLEDLTKLGYKMYPREIGLDLEHCLRAVEKLAYMHASSIVLYEKKSSMVTKYDLGIFWDNPFSKTWISIGFKELIETCKERSNLSKYTQKLISMENIILAKVFALCKAKGNLNVLNHGDFWTNNFMFSYDDGRKVLDVIFVDFQVPYYSSPALDLNFFWATSPNVEVLTHHFQSVINCYYNKFVSTLKILEVSNNIPNQIQFEEEFKSRALYGIASLCTVSPFVTANRRPDASFDNLFNNNSKNGFRFDCFNNERYVAKLEQLLPFYENLGVFE